MNVLAQDCTLRCVNHLACAVALAALLAAGCAPRIENTHDKDLLRQEAVLGVQLMDIADLGSGLMREEYAHEALNPDTDSREMAITCKLVVGISSTLRAMAISASPRDGLVQMYIWCRAGKFAAKNRERKYPGTVPDISERVYGRIEAQLQPIAERNLSAQQLASLDAVIARFTEANPELLSVGLMRLDDIAESKEAADLILPDSTPDMLSPVTDAARQLELMRLLGLQALWLVARTPDAVGMEVDSAARMVLESRPIERLLERTGSIQGALGEAGARLDSVSKSQERIAEELRGLSGSLTAIATKAERAVMFGGIGALVMLVIGFVIGRRGRKDV